MRKETRIILGILALGFLYYIWLQFTGIYIPCMFRQITGWLCPGCGITTLFVCLGKFDFQGAFQANAFLFITSPFLMFQIIYMEWIKRRGKTVPRWNQRILIAYMIALLIFGVIRNI